MLNKKIPDLLQQLHNPTNEKDRSDIILEKINENPFLFLEFMEMNEPPTPDFLRIIIQLHDQIEEDIFTQLFIRICALYKGEELNVSCDMVQRGIEFLIDIKIDHTASYGLIRFIFNNSIPLKSFNRSRLIRFQSLYSQSLSNFLKSLPLLKS